MNNSNELTAAGRQMLRGPVSASFAVTITDVIGPVDMAYFVTSRGRVLPGRSDVWPQANFQPGLQEGDGAGIGPRLAADDFPDGRVVHSGDSGDLTEAERADGVAERKHEEPDGLSGGVAAGDLRPVVSQLPRSATRTGTHARTLRERQRSGRLRLTLSAATDNAAAEDDTDGSIHDGWRAIEVADGIPVPTRHRPPQRDITDLDRQTVAAYCPASLPEHAWSRVAPFVRQAVLDYLPHSRQRQPRKLLSALAPYVVWANTAAGCDLTRESVFDPQQISYYATSVLTGMTDNTRAAVRARLLRMADFLEPAGRRAVRMTSFARQVTAPYSTREVSMVRAWPLQLSSAYRKHAAACIVNFGLGAGLRAGELSTITREDVTRDEHGVLVNVTTGMAPRAVPILAAYESQCLALAQAVRPGSLVFRSERVGTSSNSAIAKWGGKLETDSGFPINLGRLRATWILSHLNRDVPPETVLLAAGISGITSLGRFRPWIDPGSLDAFDEAFDAANRANANAYHHRYREFRLASLAQQAKQRKARTQAGGKTR
ncbi:MAG: site-specific integrase [Propionicimonas sp.]|uniref:hypothetical protein n=1 Tax=Propionicimonas sp. TaxID=1955623 RepID=UPI003D0CE6D8